MSKKYDEYIEIASKRAQNFYPYQDEVMETLPNEIDKDLTMELCDKVLIYYIELITKKEIEIPKEKIIHYVYGNDIDEHVIKRANAIISLTRLTIKKGKRITYGDIIMLVDGNEEEKKYEEQKKQRTKTK